MGFGLSKAFKSIKKGFKSVAKRIKKTAGSVMKGIMKIPGMKQIGSLYNKTFGKLGPLGMVAASLILPGVGSLIASGWGAAAGSLAGSSSVFLQSVGAGMNAISTGLSTAGSAISQGFSAVTDKIGAAFSNAGGTDSFLSKASEWVSTKYDAAANNISEAGDWIKNQTGFGDVTQSGAEGLTRTQSFARPSGFGVEQKPFDIGQVTQNGSQVFDIDNLPRVQSPASPDAGSLLAPKTPTAVDTTFSGAKGLTRVQSAAAPATAGATGESFAKNALKAGAALLGGMAVPPPEPEQFASAGSDFSEFGTQRFGVGGTGATGGQFLTPQQQAFFAQHAQLLGQVG